MATMSCVVKKGGRSWNSGGSDANGAWNHQLLPHQLAAPQPQSSLHDSLPEGEVRALSQPSHLPRYHSEHRYCTTLAEFRDIKTEYVLYFFCVPGFKLFHEEAGEYGKSTDGAGSAAGCGSRCFTVPPRQTKSMSHISTSVLFSVYFALCIFSYFLEISRLEIQVCWRGWTGGVFCTVRLVAGLPFVEPLLQRKSHPDIYTGKQ